METNKDGGGAFPQPDKASFELFSGMSLRDYFAAKALPNIQYIMNENETWEEHLEGVAEIAYQFADAMLAERLK